MPAVPFLIMGGAQLGGALLQSHQASKAADAQKAAAQQALQLQGQLYQQGRQDLNPYAQLGSSTLSNLYRMTGQAPPVAPSPRPFSATSVNNQPVGAAMALMRAPDGSTQQVPMGQVQHFLSLGARVVQPGGQQQPMGGLSAMTGAQ